MFACRFGFKAKLILSILVICLLVWLSFSQERQKAYVVRVIDGDTLELQGGQQVRLLGIDAPESFESCYAEAKQRLAELVEGKWVELERDQMGMDSHGRWLRWVFADGKNVNLQLVKEGLAKVYAAMDSLKYSEQLWAAEAQAKIKGVGCLWS